MIILEDEVVIDPVIQIYSDVKKLMRGKVIVDYKDNYETTFGVIAEAIVEMKYGKEENYLSLKFYKEPTEDTVQNLNLQNQAQPFDISFEHILAESSDEISTLFSFYIIEPKEEVEKAIIKNRNIEDYKELLNVALGVFNDYYGVTRGS